MRTRTIKKFNNQIFDYHLTSLVMLVCRFPSECNFLVTLAVKRLVALFTIAQFSVACPNFRLPFYPRFYIDVAFFSMAHFSITHFSVAFPSVAQFFHCPIFHCPCFLLPNFPLPFSVAFFPLPFFPWIDNLLRRLWPSAYNLKLICNYKHKFSGDKK